MAGSRSLLLACDFSAEQEEPWRRLLQELSEAPRTEEGYVRSRRRLGISAESVWLVPTKPRGGGLTVVYLEADNPERVLGELASSDAPFDSWYGGRMSRLLGFDVARLGQAVSGELLFAWREDDARGEREASKSPGADAASS